MKYTVTATFELGNDLDYYRLERGWDVHSWDDVWRYIQDWTIEELCASFGYPEWNDEMEGENADD